MHLRASTPGHGGFVRRSFLVQRLKMKRRSLSHPAPPMHPPSPYTKLQRQELEELFVIWQTKLLHPLDSDRWTEVFESTVRSLLMAKPLQSLSKVNDIGLVDSFVPRLLYVLLFWLCTRSTTCTSVRDSCCRAWEFGCHICEWIIVITQKKIEPMS